MKKILILCSALALCAVVGCGESDDDTNNKKTPAEVTFGVTPAVTQTVAVDGTTEYTITAPSDTQAYRITLVVKDNVTVAGAAGTFVDNDMNSAADAGASEAIALITKVNGVDQTGAKTVPGGMDDPKAPSGVFAKSGTITFTVKGVAAGTVYPVIYHNGGASTFLEIDAAGKPIETHIVAGGVTVN